MAGDTDLGLVDVVEGVGSGDVINGRLDAGVITVRRLGRRFALVVGVDNKGDVSPSCQLQGVGDLGFLGALEPWRHDDERGLALCCCGVGSEKIGTGHCSVLAGDHEALDTDVAAASLDEA